MAGVASDSGGTDIELPLAPIIDCFVVLIAFLLISAAYVSVSIFDATVAVVEETSNPSEVTSGVLASIEVKLDGTYEIVLTGDVNERHTIAHQTQLEDQKKELDLKLREIKAKHEGIKNLTVKADNTMVYRDVVNVMEVARVYYPQLLLGGF